MGVGSTDIIYLNEIGLRIFLSINFLTFIPAVIFFAPYWYTGMKSMICNISMATVLGGIVKIVAREKVHVCNNHL